MEVVEPEYEEQNIIIELEEYLGTDFILSCNTYSLIGLETEHPILKIDNYIFQGTWQAPVGTPLLFQINEDDTTNPLTYETKSTKKLVFRRVVIQERTPSAQTTATSEVVPPTSDSPTL